MSATAIRTRTNELLTHDGELITAWSDGMVFTRLKSEYENSSFAYSARGICFERIHRWPNEEDDDE